VQRLISPLTPKTTYWFKGRNTAPAVFWNKASDMIKVTDINSELSSIEKDCAPQ
jgi:hypothetical protein